jgi:hypothetical protein
MFSVGLGFDAGAALLVADRRRRGAVSEGAIAVIVAEFQSSCDVTIGLPPGDGGPGHAHRHVVRATAGWVRVRFSGLPTTLTDCDVPAELLDWPLVVAVNAPAGDGAVGLWRGFIHPVASSDCETTSPASKAEDPGRMLACSDYANSRSALAIRRVSRCEQGWRIMRPAPTRLSRG